MPCAAFEPLLVKHLLFGCKFIVGMGQQKGAIVPGRMAQQQFSIASRSGQVLQALSATRERGGKS